MTGEETDWPATARAVIICPALSPQKTRRQGRGILLESYLVLPASTFSLSLAAAWAAAKRAVSTRNGEQET